MAVCDRMREHLDRKKAGLYALLDNFGNNMEAEAKEKAPWTDRLGHARQAIHHGLDQVGDTRFELSLAHGVQYGEWLEKGTEPHTIEPVNAKALFWYGADHPVRCVNHPGSKAFPIIGPTMEENQEKVAETVQKYWGDES